MDLRQGIAEFSCCFGGQIDVENLNKLTPLNRASLFGKKKKTAWKAIVSSYLVLFIFMYRGKWEITGKWNGNDKN